MKIGELQSSNNLQIRRHTEAEAQLREEQVKFRNAETNLSLSEAKVRNIATSNTTEHFASNLAVKTQIEQLNQNLISTESARKYLADEKQRLGRLLSSSEQETAATKSNYFMVLNHNNQLTHEKDMEIQALKLAVSNGSSSSDDKLAITGFGQTIERLELRLKTTQDENPTMRTTAAYTEQVTVVRQADLEAANLKIANMEEEIHRLTHIANKPAVSPRSVTISPNVAAIGSPSEISATLQSTVTPVASTITYGISTPPVVPVALIDPISQQYQGLQNCLKMMLDQQSEDRANNNLMLETLRNEFREAREGVYRRSRSSPAGGSLCNERVNGCQRRTERYSLLRCYWRQIWDDFYGWRRSNERTHPGQTHFWQSNCYSLSVNERP